MHVWYVYSVLGSAVLYVWYIYIQYIDIYMVVCSVCRVHVGHVCTSVWCGVGMRYGRGSVYECGCIYIMYIDLYSLIAGS